MVTAWLMQATVFYFQPATSQAGCRQAVAVVPDLGLAIFQDDHASSFCGKIASSFFDSAARRLSRQAPCPSYVTRAPVP